ncbi:hypothetical protein DF196_01965 [Bifidobacterium callitrichidarum]|uniref:Uncharacterized protein n=1 Tax=Bifidobacterium callitrichidarum TaxID=2052941 RepID=A0A2U2NC60_9BIFI|nr:hypothetical protein DF196_01965 [Bifidobacterium callitrichidarum]
MPLLLRIILIFIIVFGLSTGLLAYVFYRQWDEKIWGLILSFFLASISFICIAALLVIVATLGAF